MLPCCDTCRLLLLMLFLRTLTGMLLCQLFAPCLRLLSPLRSCASLHFTCLHDHRVRVRVCVLTHLQRDKQRVLAESVHEAKSRVSQQKDRWRVQYYTNEGKLMHSQSSVMLHVLLSCT